MSIDARPCLNFTQAEDPEDFRTMSVVYGNGPDKHLAVALAYSPTRREWAVWEYNGYKKLRFDGAYFSVEQRGNSEQTLNDALLEYVRRAARITQPFAKREEEALSRPHPPGVEP